MKQEIDEISTNILTIILALIPLLILPFSELNYNNLRMVALLICGGILFVTFLLKVKNIKFHKEDICIIIFVIWAIISTIFSIDVRQSIIGADNRFEGILTILIYVLIYFHAKNSFKNFKYFEIIISTVYSGILILAIVQYYMPYNITILPIFGKGAHGTIGNTNFMGSFISIILPLVMFLYIFKGKTKYLFFSVLCFSVMIMCVARSSWVAFLVYMLIMLMYLFIKKNKNYLKKFLVLFIIFIISFCFILITNKNGAIFHKIGKIDNEIGTIREKGITNEMGSNRIEIWKMTFKVVLKKPLIGCGLDALEQGLRRYAPYDALEYLINHNQIVDKAHNEYLQIAATIGIPALILYLSFLAFIIIPIIKKVLKDEKAIILATVVIGYLIQAFFNISVISVSPLFWFVLGIASKYKNN